MKKWRRLQVGKLLHQCCPSFSFASTATETIGIARRQGARSLAEALAQLEEKPFEDKDAYPSLLQWCGKEKALILGKRIHAHIVKSGHQGDTFLGNLLVQMYGRCGGIAAARRVFDGIPRRNVFSWNIMIAAYAQNGHYKDVLELFGQMCDRGVQPISRSVFMFLVRACSSMESLAEGKLVHARIVAEGLDSDVVVGTALVNMYGRFGSLDEARCAFEKLNSKDVVSWTAMIAAYAQNMQGKLALELFKKMDVAPDAITYVSAIDACSVLRDLKEGRFLHSRILLEGFKSHVLATSLVTFYGRCGKVEAARSVFEESRHLSTVDVISWNAIIAAYAQNGHSVEAIELFEEMNRPPSGITYATVLDACADIGALEKGKAVHSSLVARRLDSDVFVGTALLNMYGRCGMIDMTRRVFDAMPKKDSVAWTAMIAAYAQNGHSREALELFYRMTKEENLQPDCVTYVGVLSACSHAGLIDEGMQHFVRMREEYQIRPVIEHYGCMIDLLGRTGQLEEAEDLIKKMPFDPNAVIWTALLGACSIHSDVERGVRAAEAMFKLDPSNAEPYVALSNMYASAGRVDDAAKLRARLTEAGVKIRAGRSLIEVDNKVHEFGGCNSQLRNHNDIIAELERLSMKMKEMGFVTKIPFHDVNPRNEEHKLVGDHSERLAMAFGLISTPAGTPLHIVKKNLRMCEDCHSAMKFVSQMVGRVIRVRDNSRIHHLQNGACSCQDYW